MLMYNRCLVLLGAIFVVVHAQVREQDIPSVCIFDCLNSVKEYKAVKKEVSLVIHTFANIRNILNTP